MANARLALSSAGADLHDVVRATVHVASSDRVDLTAVVHHRFGAHDPPSALIGVTALGYPDQLVEVEAIAALEE